MTFPRRVIHSLHKYKVLDVIIYGAVIAVAVPLVLATAYLYAISEKEEPDRPY